MQLRKRKQQYDGGNRKKNVVRSGDDSSSLSVFNVSSSASDNSTVEDAHPDTEVAEDIVPPSVPVRQTNRTRRSTPEQRAQRLAKARKTIKEKREAQHPELVEIWNSLDGIVPQEHVEPLLCQPSGLTVELLNFQLHGLNWMRKQEHTMFSGGILADEMGMGKTLSILSLILTDVGDLTLVVCPAVAVKQWLSEINNKTDLRALRPVIYHGQYRKTVIENLENYNLLITSYNTLEADYRRQQSGFTKNGVQLKEPSPLHSINWHRIVFDEAHAFKERSTNTARSVFNLTATYKWSLTGTPLQNRVGDLYGLVRVLKADPFSYYFCQKCPCKSINWLCVGSNKCSQCSHSSMQHFSFWNTQILKPITNGGTTAGEGKVAFQRLRSLLSKIMIRRTKIGSADDLGLPPKNVYVRRDQFNLHELDFYESLYSATKRQFNTYVSENTVLSNYANIFELISRLRLAANHPDLVSLKYKQVKDQHVCGICSDQAEDCIVAKCKHKFCRLCAIEYLDFQNVKCPTCFVLLTIDLEQDALEDNEQKEVTQSSKHPTKVGYLKKSIINKIDMKTWRSSTKIEALVEELTHSVNNDHNIKSIVFSQFTNFLDLCQWRLNRAGFKCSKLYGSMSLEKRAAAIETFNTDPSVNVFLISLKAGGVALNLTEASQVFLLDPWWNGAVEHQAMDRVHRLGQTRPLRIIRLIIQDSIESRIIQLQEKKSAMAEMCIGDEQQVQQQKLTEEDLQFLFVL
eukprot:NODE_57_length_25931_cov_0.351037.p2 type:complete len:742 gc:universal NODE_57_length_25931_cov_0.351037:22830-20605(-)